MIANPSLFDTRKICLTMSARSPHEKLFANFGMAESASHAAPGKDQDPVGYGQHFGKLGRDKKDSETFVCQAINNLKNFRFGAHINSSGGLVKQKYLWSG